MKKSKEDSIASILAFLGQEKPMPKKKKKKKDEEEEDNELAILLKESK
jgi:hypothetical protein